MYDGLVRITKGQTMTVKHTLWLTDIGYDDDARSLADWLSGLTDAAPSAWVRVISGPTTAQDEVSVEIQMSLADEAAVGTWYCADAFGFIRGDYSERELV